MVRGFWEKIEKPIIVLAPMADVTDAAFRQLIARHGKPDVMWTEFVSADGLYQTREVQQRPDTENPLMKDLLYTEAERPIVAQLFSPRPDMMRYGAALAAELGFDGIDINMGCPDKSIVKQGSGSGHIRDPENAQAVIRAAMDGAPNLPVSVKTRLGDRGNEIETWLPKILATEPAVVTMHARTRAELSKVPARWQEVAHAVSIRNEMGSDTYIFGNGDVVDIPDALAKVEETGADGVMMGKAIFGNPWRFANLANAKRCSQIERPPQNVLQRCHQGEECVSAFQTKHATQSRNRPSDERSECVADSGVCTFCGGFVEYVPSVEERLSVLEEHAQLFAELLPHKSFAVMKKHFKAYVTGWDGAKELRAELMEANTADEVSAVIKKALPHAPTESITHP